MTRIAGTERACAEPELDTNSEARDRLRASGAAAAVTPDTSFAFASTLFAFAVLASCNFPAFFVTANGRIGANVGTTLGGIAIDDLLLPRRPNAEFVSFTVPALDAVDVEFAGGGAVNTREILLAPPPTGFVSGLGNSCSAGGGDGGRCI